MRISIFVDGSNLFYLTKYQLGWSVDLRKLIDYYNSQGIVTDAYYYTAIDNDSINSNKFLSMLPSMGFAVITKPLKTVGYGTATHKKGNMDIEMVMDMLNTIEIYDMAILVSGDGDFMRPLEYLRSRGKRFQVLSHPSVVAKELLFVAGLHYVNISTLEKDLTYTQVPSSEAEDILESIEDMSQIEAEYPI